MELLADDAEIDERGASVEFLCKPLEIESTDDCDDDEGDDDDDDDDDDDEGDEGDEGEKEPECKREVVDVDVEKDLRDVIERKS